MKLISLGQEKELMQLENRWLKHKRVRNKTNCIEHPDYLQPRERENILDEVFKIYFND